MGLWGTQVVGGGRYVVTKDRKAPLWVWIVGGIILLALLGK